MLWRKGSPNKHFNERQNWMAASLWVAHRPRLPVLPANQVIPLSNQILSEPQDFSSALYAFLFFLPYQLRWRLWHLHVCLITNLAPSNLYSRFVQSRCTNIWRAFIARKRGDFDRLELKIRLLIVGYCYGIRSERRLCENVYFNPAYRWFCRLGLEDASQLFILK